MKNKNIDFLIRRQKIPQVIYCSRFSKEKFNLPFKMDNVITDIFKKGQSVEEAADKEWKRVFCPHAVWDGQRLILGLGYEIILCTK